MCVNVKVPNGLFDMTNLIIYIYNVFTSQNENIDLYSQSTRIIESKCPMFELLEM